MFDPAMYPTGAAAQGGTAFDIAKVFTQSVTAAEVAAATAEEQDVTITESDGVNFKAGDIVVVNPAATGNATAIGGARVKSAGVVAIQYVNPTAGALTPGAGNYTFLLLRPRS